MSRDNPPPAGIGFLGVLTLIFITLKLTGHITWPWVWVLSPIWLPIVLVLGLVLLAMLVLAIFPTAIALFVRRK